MNFIDKIINFFNPQAGLKRVQSRARQDILKDYVRKYDGAANSRRTENWVTSTTDSNAEVRSALATLRNRSRDLVRNNSWAERVMSLYENNVIGKGIQVQFYSSNKKLADIINRVWTAWADSTDCDWSETSSFVMLQRLATRTIAESGEVLIRMHVDKSSKVPLKLELLEPDFINTNQMEARVKGNYVIDGIEVDGRGRKVSYNLYKSHPGASDIMAIVKGGAFESVNVEAKYLVHGYRMNRSGQLRGVPLLAPVIINMREFDEYMDAQIVKQKISACMTAFITDPQGSTDMSTEEQEVASHFEPGTINILGPGQNVEVASPPTIEGLGEFTATTLRSIAVGTGLSYEALSGDLSQVNFSSARMGWLEMARNIDVWREQMMIPMVFEKIVRMFITTIELTGTQIPKDLTWKYTSPRREMIDPTREIPATIEGIRGGLITLSDAIKQSGNDPEVHLNEIEAMNAKLDEKKIILDCDPRHEKTKFMQEKNKDEQNIS